jgi:Tol biopolymer transport system component
MIMSSIALCALAQALSSVQAHASRANIRISLTTDGREGDKNSSHSYLSNDGRYVVYRSRATNLAPGDTNGVLDAFLRDRDMDGDGIYDESGDVKTIRLSLSAGGAQTFAGAGSTGISDDGRWVSIGCHGDELVPEDHNGWTDVFVVDRDPDQDGTYDEPGGNAVILISISDQGVQGNARSYDSRISADGRSVVFQSWADNLVPGDNNGDEMDLFVDDRDADGNGVYDEPGGYHLSRVSLNSQGIGANGVCAAHEISADAAQVVFESQATNLDPLDTDANWDVFVRDLRRGKTVLLSRNSLGAPGNGQSRTPGVSASGRFVVFESVASNLVPGDNNGLADIFLVDRDVDENGIFDEPGSFLITRISLPNAGGEANGDSANPSISGDGMYIAYESFATNLTQGATLSGSIYIYDRAGNRTVLAASGNKDSRFAAFSRNGQWITFDSQASDLVSDDNNHNDDVFVHSVYAEFHVRSDEPGGRLPRFEWKGRSAGDQFGFGVEIAGDVNRDGFDDFIVGAPFEDHQGDDRGCARVFSGFDGSVLHVFEGDNAGDQFGWSVDGAGDVDADGFADLVIGARFDDDQGAACGSVRVHSGFDGSILYTFYGDAAGNQFGFSVAGVGDVDGDGHDDVIGGARGDDAQGSQCGSARVFSGADGSILHTFYGDSRNDLMGWSVGRAGDVNADGYADLIVSAHRNDVSGRNSGSAYVFSGLDGSQLHRFDGRSEFDEFGFDVDGAGDVDQDGYDDLIVGARFELVNGLRIGRARILSGRTGGVIHVVEGPKNLSEFGFEVDGAGDFDGDGIDDFIVGARFDPAGGLRRGTAFVYSGSDASVLAAFSGGEDDDQFGIAVAGGARIRNSSRTGILIGGCQGDYSDPTGNGYARVFTYRVP